MFFDVYDKYVDHNGFLNKGDHVVVQQTIYGGAYNFIVEEFPKYGIEFDFTVGFSKEDFNT